LHISPCKCLGVQYSVIKIADAWILSLYCFHSASRTQNSDENIRYNISQLCLCWWVVINSTDLRIFTLRVVKPIARSLTRCCNYNHISCYDQSFFPNALHWLKVVLDACRKHHMSLNFKLETDHSEQAIPVANSLLISLKPFSFFHLTFIPKIPWLDFGLD
jgi:hypothetical protein